MWIRRNAPPRIPLRVKIEEYADVVELGSDASAACGGSSELSAWQRSTDEEGALPPTKMSGTATGRLIGFRCCHLSEGFSVPLSLRTRPLKWSGNPFSKSRFTCFYKSWIRRNAPPRIPLRVKIEEYADVVELVDSLDLGSNARACRFESCHPHQISLIILIPLVLKLSDLFFF